MRDVAILSFAQSASVRREARRNEVEILMPVVREAVARSGIPRAEIDFICSGSTDYLQGSPFAFVMGLDAVGAWPPVAESHVEMDGAFALYEAWVKIQTGQAESALVYGFGKSSPGDVAEILALQLDPYTVAPLWPDAVSLAALQARLCLEAGVVTEKEMAEVAARSRRDALSNPNAQLRGEFSADALLSEPYLVDPLRRHDCPPISDGAAAMVIASAEAAARSAVRPVFIRGFDHRAEPQDLGVRDLTRSVSTELAGEKAGVGRAPVELAELYAPFTHQEILLRRALGLGDGVRINPSGGPLAANPLMAAGLIRVGEAAARVASGEARRAVAHATSGPCLQQNLVCVLEGE